MVISSRMKDLSGIRFGRLTAREFSGSNAHKKAEWLCICDCGSTVKAVSSDLSNGHTQSCGCFRDEKTSERRKSHGKTGTPEYYAWAGAKGRCYNSNDKRFADWGGRGIRMCEKWLNDFSAFLEDMGEKPSSSHSIDRIDNDGDYSPDNCRWATPSEQGLNKRVQKANKSGVTGVYFHKVTGKWAAQIRINRIGVHLGVFSNFDDAVAARSTATAAYTAGLIADLF